jgi:hypothetical protein
MACQEYQQVIVPGYFTVPMIIFITARQRAPHVTFFTTAAAPILLLRLLPLLLVVVGITRFNFQ